MKILNFNYDDKNVEIITEKKKLFGGRVQETETIPLNMISIVSKEVFEGKLNSMTLFLKDGNEKFIACTDMENDMLLEDLIAHLISKKEENMYKVKMLDIATMQEQEI